jgi:hypothetical protein
VSELPEAVKLADWSTALGIEPDWDCVAAQVASIAFSADEMVPLKGCWPARAATMTLRVAVATPVSRSMNVMSA